MKITGIQGNSGWRFSQVINMVKKCPSLNIIVFFKIHADIMGTKALNYLLLVMPLKK